MKTVDDFVFNDWKKLLDQTKNFLKDEGYDEVESFVNMEGNRVVTFVAYEDDGEGLKVPVRIAIDYDYQGM